MIPLNGHVQIEPEVKEDFIASSETTYNEVGLVVAVADGINSIQEGDRVYFDSWTASKYPKKDGTFYWLVDFANIRAYDKISEERVQEKLPTQVQDSTVTQSGSSGEV